MAITESDYLRIRKEKTPYLLLRGPSHFHLIRADAGLTAGKLAKLLRLYPCGTEQIRQLGLQSSAFKVSSLRGVVTKGVHAGDRLELWIGADVRVYQLDRDYTEEFLENFFSGYPVTQRQGSRFGGREISWGHKIAWSVNGISIACTVLFFLFHEPYWLWSILCILCQLAVLVLCILYPAAFSLADKGKKERKSIFKDKGNLLPGLMAPSFALSLRTLTDFTFDTTGLLLLYGISCVVFLILFAPLFWIRRKTQDRALISVSVVILTIFLGMGTAGQLNYLLDLNNAQRQILETVDKRISRGRKSTRYYCTVQLPDGELMELSLSGSTYGDIIIGENVVVTHYDGALGIPFSTIETVPEEG